MSDLILIGGMTLITFAIRYAMFAASGRFEIPAIVAKLLRYVPVAVLSAIIAPAVLIPNGTDLRIDLGSPHLAGAVVAIVIGRVTGNLLAVIVSGMAVFWLWQAPFMRAIMPF